eukprot:COSAG02_NODE_1346_length_13140_cov_106.669964_8_plen_184_part_00
MSWVAHAPAAKTRMGPLPSHLVPPILTSKEPAAEPLAMKSMSSIGGCGDCGALAATCHSTASVAKHRAAAKGIGGRDKVADSLSPTLHQRVSPARSVRSHLESECRESVYDARAGARGACRGRRARREACMRACARTHAPARCMHAPAPAYECYARVEAPDWRFSDKRVIIFRPNITPKRLGY